MKRLISWLLALTLICGLLPLSAISAFAAPEIDVVDPTEPEPDFTEEFGNLLETTAPEETEPAEGTYENPQQLVVGKNTLIVTPGTSFYAAFPNDGKDYEIEVYSVAAYQVAYGRGYQMAEGDSTITMELNAEAAQFLGYVVTFDSFGEDVTAIYVNLSEKVVVPGTSERNPIELTVSKDAPASATATYEGNATYYAVAIADNGYVKVEGVDASFSINSGDSMGSDSLIYAVTAGEVMLLEVGSATWTNGDYPFTVTYVNDEEAASIEAALAVKDQIDALVVFDENVGDWGEWVLKSGVTYKTVEAARAAYDALTEPYKSFIDAGGKLWTAEDLIANCDAHDSITGGKACEICGRFSVTGANMNLGNELTMNFAIKSSYVTDTGSYALISLPTKDTSGKYSDVERKVYYEDWDNRGSILVIPFNGIAARQMADELTVTIYDSNDNVISIPYTDSVRNYVMRNIDGTTFSANMKVLAVDMLNYGAAAQNFFTYNTGDLANSLFTDAHKALATTSIDVEDGRIQGTNYKGTNLDLGSKLVMQMAFSNAVTADMYAVATFTKYDGSAQSVVIKGSEFDIRTGLTVIPVAAVTVPDASQLVTVVVYDSTGNEIGSATDSIASYIARQANASDLYIEIMKFATSAREYFLNK